MKPRRTFEVKLNTRRMRNRREEKQERERKRAIDQIDEAKPVKKRKRGSKGKEKRRQTNQDSEIMEQTTHQAQSPSMVTNSTTTHREEPVIPKIVKEIDNSPRWIFKQLNPSGFCAQSRQPSITKIWKCTGCNATVEISDTIKQPKPCTCHSK